MTENMKSLTCWRMSAREMAEESVIRGGVKIQKRDSETGEAKPQGSATLEGTVFAITTLNENPVLVDGTSYTKDH